MPQLQTRVPEKLAGVIKRVQIEKEMKKGQAMKMLVMLAVRNLDYVSSDFGDGDTTNCTLVLSEANYVKSLEYRKKHELATKAAFFRDALARGASVYEGINAESS